MKEISRGGQSTHQLWQDGVLTTYLKGIQRSHERREVTLHPDVQSNLQTIAVSLNNAIDLSEDAPVIMMWFRYCIICAVC